MNILDLLFPSKCLGCKKPGNYICLKCIKKISSPEPICPLCKKHSQSGKTHKSCKKKGNLEGLISVWRYQGVIKRAILKLKYSFVTKISDELISISTLRLKENRIEIPQKAILIPIPLSQKRKNWRGFNQSEILGRKLAEKLKLRFVSDLLIRRKETQPQSGLSKEQREKNISNVFIVNSRYKRKSKQPIYIFDDVWTTGSTIKEAAKTLKEKGFNNLWSLTLAK